MNPNRAELDELLDLFEYTGKDELPVLLQTARRLAMGLRQYGPLDVEDGRRWRTQAAEELVDTGVYGCCELVREAKEAERVREARLRTMSQEERAQVELQELERRTAMQEKE